MSVQGYGCFNSQPHEEADNTPGFFIFPFDVSTHSLTRRLTRKNPGKTRIAAFQLTASRGGWLPQCRIRLMNSRFNSQPHEEADPWPQPDYLKRWRFNSQPHEEADEMTEHLLMSLVQFQLTASRGGWQRTGDCVVRAICVSTHSLTRRLTGMTVKKAQLRCMFQLTASRGGWRRISFHRSRIWIVSTHSLTRRLTRSADRHLIFPERFNSQPHEEADDYPQLAHGDVDVSTHSLTRRLTI